MRWLVSTSLRFRVVVIAIAALLLLFSQQALRETRLDVFPEFAPPLVEIQTEAPGLSSAEVESLVTVPIESVVNGVSWLKTVRSTSVLGMSSVVLIFEDDVDVLRARQLVQERLTRLAAILPAVARQPVMLSPLSSTSRVLKIGLWSDALSQMDLTALARWTVRPRLMALPGVANVAIWGQRDRQLQVLVDPERLRAHEVTLAQVLDATRNTMLIDSGGFVDTPNQRLPVAHRPAITGADDLAATTAAFRAGTSLRLGEVAEVVEGFPPPIGDAVVNDVPGLLLIVEKEPWSNTLDVTHAVEETLEALRPGLADVQMDATIFRPATFIETSLANLNQALLLGCVLVILVLAFFLYEWRTALISVLAIPLSLIAAVLVLHYRGGTIDTMVLAGLVIALGEVVDDAIIDVENIMRRLRLNREQAQPAPALQVVLAASMEVRSAVVYATLIVVLVVLPVFFLGGLSGTFFRPLVLAYVLAILASLLVAMTVTPALALVLLPAATEHPRESPGVRWLTARYGRALRRLVRAPRGAALALALSVLLTAVCVPLLGQEFLPHFKERDFLMHWVEKPGTSLEAMRRITTRVSRELRAIPGVRNFGAHIGRAEVADEVVGPNFTELWVSLDPAADYDEAVGRIQETVDGYPGLYRDVLTYLRERIKEVLAGASATIVVRVYGPELEILRERAEAIAAAIADVEGVVDLEVEPQTLVPQIEVRFLPDRAAQFGLTAGGVRQAVSTLVRGTKVGEFFDQQMVFDVTVWGVPAVRHDLHALRELRLDTPTGGTVPLGEVAELTLRPAPNVIKREAASRRIDVTCNVRGRDLGRVAHAIEARVHGLDFPRGYHPEFLGEWSEQQRARQRLIALALLSLVGVFLLLHADFGSTPLALLVLLGLPFALVGSILMVVLTGGVLSLGSLIGLITVLGIAARNSLMLLSHYRHLEEEERMPFGVELVVRGAEERLAPILMTALTTGLALVPIALGGDLPGYEIEYPVAMVILGGLISSTTLNLLMMPTLYLAWRTLGARSAAGSAAAPT